MDITYVFELTKLNGGTTTCRVARSEGRLEAWRYLFFNLYGTEEILKQLDTIKLVNSYPTDSAK